MEGKVALLDAAEKLFAERGYYGASMRDITSLAEVPHGLVTYHFRSKDDLFQSVIERRIGSFLEILGGALDDLLVRHATPPLGDVVEAYIGSHIRFAASGEAERDYMRLAQMLIAVGKRRGLTESLWVAAIPVVDRYGVALRNALADARAEDVDTGFHLLRLTLAGVLVDIDLPDLLTAAADGENIRRISRYCAGGFERLAASGD